MKIQENTKNYNEMSISGLAYGKFFRFVNEFDGKQYGLGLRLEYNSTTDCIDAYDFENNAILPFPCDTTIVPIAESKLSITIERE